VSSWSEMTLPEIAAGIVMVLPSARIGEVITRDATVSPKPIFRFHTSITGSDSTFGRVPKKSQCAIPLWLTNRHERISEVHLSHRSEAPIYSHRPQGENKARSGIQLLAAISKS
jgi:hypothetical protein